MWSLVEVLRLTQGKGIVDAAEAARILGYPTAKALLEQIRRGRVAVDHFYRGRRLMFGACALVDALNRQIQRSSSSDALPFDEGRVAVVLRKASVATGEASIKILDGEREFLRKLAKRM